MYLKIILCKDTHLGKHWGKVTTHAHTQHVACSGGGDDGRDSRVYSNQRLVTSCTLPSPAHQTSPRCFPCRLALLFPERRLRGFSTGARARSGFACLLLPYLWVAHGHWVFYFNELVNCKVLLVHRDDLKSVCWVGGYVRVCAYNTISLDWECYMT